MIPSAPGAGDGFLVWIGNVSRIRRRLALSVSAGGWLGAAASAMAGVVILVGWLLQVPLVVTAGERFVGMALSAAIGVLICGLAVVYRAFRLREARSPICMVAGIAAVLVAVVNLGMLLAGSALGIEAYLRPHATQLPGSYMSPATSICLAFAGLCVAIQGRRHQATAATVYSCSATAGLMIAAIALIGYMYDVKTLYRISIYSAMAMETAIGFVLVFAALHLVRPTWGWMRALIAAGPGSEALRMLLPGVLAAPIFFTWLALSSVETAPGRDNATLALLALACAGFLVMLVFRSTLRLNSEMSAQRLATLRLNKALAQRDLLLSEVYHRVKNNLQFMDAMLAIEGRKLSDPAASEVLETVRSRLHSLSRVHSRLLASPDLATLDLRDLLGDVCRDLAEGAGAADRGIRIETALASAAIDWETAIPIGLLVNEIVTNAIKHAFPDGRPGLIEVSASRIRDGVGIRIRDDGVGAGSGSADDQSSGAMIVETLARQLGATMEITRDGGTEVSVTVPLSWPA